jgi:hypothetical protein
MTDQKPPIAADESWNRAVKLDPRKYPATAIAA